MASWPRPVLEAVGATARSAAFDDVAGEMSRAETTSAEDGRGNVGRGNVDRGNVDRGNVDRGNVERGNVERGIVERGIVERQSVAGNVPHVPLAFARQCCRSHRSES